MCFIYLSGFCLLAAQFGKSVGEIWGRGQETWNAATI